MFQRVALVTGASRGIGRAIAHTLCKANYAIVIASPEIEKNEEVAGEICACGGECMTVDFNVASQESVKAGVDAVMQKLRRIDVLVNNAGITRDRTILKMTNGEWNEVIDVNLSGAFWCLREASRLMSKEGRGSIINIASILAVKPGFGNANYAASKAGLIALTKAAAKELGRFHITVNAVLPGFHETDMASGLPAEHKKKVIGDHVIGQSTRMEDLCRMVIEVSQNPSVSGQVFNVDSRVV